MHSMHNKQIALSEAASWSGATLEDGVLKNVKLLGEVSKNGNIYPQATRKNAHRFMEGVRVNLNHLRTKGDDRGVMDRVGKLINVREQQDGTYADFHFLTSHPFAPALMEAAKRMPDLYGFSINGRGRVTKNKKGENIVESIDELRSVDLVADPATTKGLLEATEAPEAKSCEQLVGELIAALVTEGKEDLVKDMIKFKKKLGGGDGDAPEAPDDAAEAVPAQESDKTELQALRAEKAARTLLESHKITPDTELIEALVVMPSSQQEQFIKWHKRTRSVQKPRSSEPVVQLEESKKDWGKILRSVR